jgi:hypothetical protein
MAPNLAFSSTELFSNAVTSVQQSSAEQILIERAIGRAVLNRLTGGTTTLLAAYQGIGGVDPVSTQIFGSMEAQFNKVTFATAKPAAETAAISAAAKGSKSSLRSENPVFQVSNTALNTLANLGTHTLLSELP